MNWAALERTLWRAARAAPPDDRVPYAFEQRVMARLKALEPVDPWRLWTRVWWRASIPCVAISLLLGLWWVGMGRELADAGLAGDLEAVVYAGLTQPTESP
jgi:hypothetical protein